MLFSVGSTWNLELRRFYNHCCCFTDVGYHLYIVKTPSCNADHVLRTINNYAHGVQLESNVGAELSFVLPKEQSAKFEQLLGYLEQNQASLGITSFGVSVTTLEEVFLK